MENEKTNNMWIWIIVAIIVIIGLFFMFTRKGATTTTENSANGATSTPTSSLAIRPYGEVTLKLGETANFNGIAITPLSIEEDSRCAQGVQCIQAGTVRVNVKTLRNGGLTAENIVGLNAPVVVGTFSVNLTAVTPAPKANSKIADADYRLTFRVNQSAVIDNELMGK